MSHNGDVLSVLCFYKGVVGALSHVKSVMVKDLGIFVLYNFSLTEYVWVWFFRTCTDRSVLYQIVRVSFSPTNRPRCPQTRGQWVEMFRSSSWLRVSYLLTSPWVLQMAPHLCDVYMQVMAVTKQFTKKAPLV